MPVGIFKVKRAKDGKIIAKENKYKILKDFCFGYDLLLKQGLLTGYSVEDKETGEILVKKGKM